MRSLHELYLILWDSIKDKDFDDGLCMEIFYLFGNHEIKGEEYDVLIEHFESQKPNENLHSEFLKSNSWKGCGYWWYIGKESSDEDRKLFIKKMIEITKENDNTPED